MNMNPPKHKSWKVCYVVRKSDPEGNHYYEDHSAEREPMSNGYGMRYKVLHVAHYTLSDAERMANKALEQALGEDAEYFIYSISLENSERWKHVFEDGTQTGR